MGSWSRLDGTLGRTERLRTRLVLAGFVLLSAYIGQRLVRVQIWPDSRHERSARLYKDVLAATRGTIYDRHGREHVLAQTVPQHIFVADASLRSETADMDAIRTALLEMGFPTARVERACSLPRSSKYYRLGVSADNLVKERIATDPLFKRWIHVEPSSKRIYPLGRDLCHVVGAVSADGKPAMGVEASCQPYLRETNGLVRGVSDGAGLRELRERRTEFVPPRDGNDVFLTIDRDLQLAVEEALTAGCTNFWPGRACSCEGAWAVVQDCRTGEILAMASRPNFDCAAFGLSTPEEQANGALVKQYEPGSVMKPFVAAAAIEEGLVTTETLLDVRPGLYGGKPLRDHAIPDGVTHFTVAQTLAKSSNRGSARLGMLLGRKRHQEYLHAFGFGRKTGIPLRGELAGRTIGDGSELNALQVSFGQGMVATGIQLVCAYSALANGGRLFKPILVKEVRDPEGKVVFRAEPEVVSQPISAKTSATMMEALSRVTVRGEGTARRAAMPGYTIAGKTGTSQKAIRGGYSRTKHFCSFVGVFPASDPRLTILVTLDAPTPDSEGGMCAAPIFKVIAQAACNLYRIEPDDPPAASAAR